MTNVRINRTILDFVPINTATYTIAAGAAGYVDQDVSVATGTDVNKVWLIAAFKNGSGIAGARAHGVLTDSQVDMNNTVTIFSKVDPSGHMDLYRDAAVDVKYEIMGYFV